MAETKAGANVERELAGQLRSMAMTAAGASSSIAAAAVPPMRVLSGNSHRM